MDRLLIADCFLEGLGSSSAFIPEGDVPHRLVQATRDDGESLPRDVDGLTGIVVTGSPASVLEERPWSVRLEDLLSRAFRVGLPLFGVCFGHQLIAKSIFGRDAVRRAPQPELGWFDVEVVQMDPLLQAQAPGFRCFLSHFDEVVAGGGDYEVLARSERCAVEAMRIPRHPVWGVQFHAELKPREAEMLLAKRVAEHPELGIETRTEHVGAVDTSSIWRSIYSGFLDQVARHRSEEECRRLRQAG